MFNSYDLSDLYVKVDLKISFTTEEIKNPSLKELGDFLMAISKIHEFTILNSQNEYTQEFTTYENRIRIFPFHEIETITFCRKNPFDMELCFYISKEGVVSYMTFLKVLLFICKRYGENSNELSISIDNLRLLMIRIGECLKSNELISKHLELLNNNLDLEIYLQNLNAILTKILSNQVFRRHYNQICRTSLTITNLVSSVPEMNETFDFFRE